MKNAVNLKLRICSKSKCFNESDKITTIIHCFSEIIDSCYNVYVKQ